MDLLKKELTEEIIASEPHEAKKREAAYQVMYVMDQIDRHFQSILTDGSFARLQLDRSKKNG